MFDDDEDKEYRRYYNDARKGWIIENEAGDEIGFIREDLHLERYAAEEESFIKKLTAGAFILIILASAFFTLYGHPLELGGFFLSCMLSKDWKNEPGWQGTAAKICSIARFVFAGLLLYYFCWSCTSMVRSL